MNDPFRSPDPQPLTPKKIVRIVVRKRGIYGLDEDGVLWFAEAHEKYRSRGPEQVKGKDVYGTYTPSHPCGPWKIAQPIVGEVEWTFERN